MNLHIGNTTWHDVSPGAIGEAIRQVTETRKATIAKSAKTTGKADTNPGASTTAAPKRDAIAKKASGKAINGKDARKDAKRKAKAGSESTGYAKGDRIWERRGEVWARAFGRVPVKESSEGKPVRESEPPEISTLADEVPKFPLHPGMNANESHMQNVLDYARGMGHPANVGVSLSDYIGANGDPTSAHGGWPQYGGND